MSEERDSSSQKDLTPLLKGWDYEPGTINVRKIFGHDGKHKIQMRVELGILQMELEGRPDGAKPHGFESLLDFHQSQLKEYQQRNGEDAGFHLNSAQCESLREEAQLYYRRYLSLFVLEDFAAVVRDTDRNLRVLDFCAKFAADDQDRIMLEQFRPYILMMKARASASIARAESRFGEAIKIIDSALETIRDFFSTIGQPESFAQSSEVRLLQKMARDIRRKMPIDPMDKLRTELDRAVKAERYEDAARLRDEMKKQISVNS